jgi:hypothetical protein
LIQSVTPFGKILETHMNQQLAQESKLRSISFGFHVRFESERSARQHLLSVVGLLMCACAWI